MRKVVVTGLGIISPIGNNVSEVTDSLKSAIADLSESVTSETLLPIGDIIPNPVTTTFLIYLIKPTFNPSA